jgi:hypothetical protein
MAPITEELAHLAVDKLSRSCAKSTNRFQTLRNAMEKSFASSIDHESEPGRIRGTWKLSDDDNSTVSTRYYTLAINPNLRSE